MMDDVFYFKGKCVLYAGIGDDIILYIKEHHVDGIIYNLIWNNCEKCENSILFTML